MVGMLGERIDGEEGLVRSCPLPVRLQFVLMDLCPLAYELELAARQRSGEHSAVEGDRGHPPGVLSVEVGA
jgi:hypothetical protein